MVLLADDPHVLEVKVCNLSLYRHEKSTQLFKKRNNAIMGDNVVRHMLPLVEPHPFTKTSWRREKSMPDFYDRHFNSETIPTAKFDEHDVTVLTSRLMRSLDDEKRSTATRHLRNQPPMKTHGSHPKVDFTFGPITQWRTQDMIPSFVSRFERSKPIQRFYEKHEFSDASRSVSAKLNRDQTKKPPYKISVNGDHLNQRILKRHLLYLNPLDSYGRPEPNSLPGSLVDHRDLNKECGVEQSFRLKNSSIPKPRLEFVLNDVRMTEGERYHSRGVKLPMGNSHKFNSKIGAARSALDILGRSGPPTTLELSLKEELSSSTERLRRDRALVQSFMVNTSSQYIPTDRNTTPGERLLQQAREANRPRKKKPKPVTYFDGSVNTSSPSRFDSILNGGHFPLPEQSDIHLKIEEEHAVNSQFDEVNTENLTLRVPGNANPGTGIANKQTENEQTENEHTENELKTTDAYLDEIINVNSQTTSRRRGFREAKEKATEENQKERSFNMTLGRSSSARETRLDPITSEQNPFANRHVPEININNNNRTRSGEGGGEFLDNASRRSADEDLGVSKDEDTGTLNEDVETNEYNGRPKTTTEFLHRIMIKVEPSAVTAQA